MILTFAFMDTERVFICFGASAIKACLKIKLARIFGPCVHVDAPMRDSFKFKIA
jgi:hypothetical protein